MKKVLTYLTIIAVALINALNYELFVFPNSFAPAGLNGICTMIQFLTGINVGYMSLLVNIPLAIVVYLLVSKPLALRSMVYVLTFSLALLLFGKIDFSPIAYETENGTSKILGPVTAGIINGFCYAMLLRASAYSGGTDFIAALIHKRDPNKSIFSLIFALNVCVAVSSFFVYDFQMEPVLLCIVYSFLSSTVSERTVQSGRSAVRFEIITEHPDEIADAIVHRLHHSATLLPGKGVYKGKETNVLVCVVNKTQAETLSAIVRSYPHTFAAVSQVGKVVGNFKYMTSRNTPAVDLLDDGDGKAV